MENREKKILFDREQILNRVKELGNILSKDYKDKTPIVISLLKGSFIFCSDLVREMNITLEIEFLETSSYGDDEVSSGDVKILSNIKTDLEGRDVIIVDDIIDTGRTLKKVVEEISAKNPASLKTCVLLDKPSRRVVDISADYVGFEIDDVFIVGYGLNYKSYYRNVPYIFIYI